MRSLCKLPLVILGLMLVATPAAAQNVIEYQIRIEKVELCFDANCTGTLTVGASAQSFDIAGGAQGAAIGSYGEPVRPAVGDVFTHLAVTVSRTIQATGTTTNNAGCATQAGNNGAIGASAAGGAVGTRGSASLVVPGTAVIGVDLETNPGNLTFAQSLTWVGGTQATAPSARLIYPLTQAFQVTDRQPNIDVKFNTNAALQDIGGCQIIPRDPDVQVTIQ